MNLFTALERWLIAASLFSIACLSACSGGSSGNAGTEQTSSTPVIAAQEGINGPVSSTATLKSITPLAPGAQPSTSDAARFLAQASFGPTGAEEIAQVQQLGFEQWLTHQFSLSHKSQLAYLRQQSPREANGKPRDEMSYEAIWQQWLYGEEQLRARAAYALSQLFVVSNIAPDLSPEAMSSYMDMLNNQAFGTYRQLLEAVTLHPTMGYYLNMIESSKEDPAKGTHPNENYAREVMQLFSIGLVKLDLDGTPLKDANGSVIPTYDEDVVKGYAKAFSGWSFGGRDTSKSDTFQSGEENFLLPMQAWASRHSTAAKKILDGQVIPAGQTPQQDLQMALDSIATHPNVAPFVSRRLIQRLVSSNPSPAYIRRVATVFNDSGSGVRGDLRAVIRAILLDSEAREVSPAAQVNAGKMREPVIRLANLLRIMKAKSSSGHTNLWALESTDYGLGQSPLLAPSVFNFYSPDFKPAGAIAQAGLVAPEFQITTDATTAGSIGFLLGIIREGSYRGGGMDANKIILDYSAWDTVASDAALLIDRINLLLMNNSMAATTRTSMMRAINSIDPKLKSDRTRIALSLAMLSPEFVIQR